MYILDSSAKLGWWDSEYCQGNIKRRAEAVTFLAIRCRMMLISEGKLTWMQLIAEIQHFLIVKVGKAFIYWLAVGHKAFTGNRNICIYFFCRKKRKKVRLLCVAVCIARVRNSCILLLIFGVFLFKTLYSPLRLNIKWKTPWQRQGELIIKRTSYMTL